MMFFLAKVEPDKVKKKTDDTEGLQYILVTMIIDSDGIPNCLKFRPELESVIKKKFSDQLKLLRFKPALQKGKKVESIYTLKI